MNHIVTQVFANLISMVLIFLILGVIVILFVLYFPVEWIINGAVWFVESVVGEIF